ncbi:Tim44 domain-containing protein [Ramlibacter sp. G-1-2-2]|uniref:Tim44 domain-containing protein n=1 Tax=Ramlibacter agri TaxID=2728837 RepID=A0A848HH86_9BURK|nr:Tim44-like domain-containing protein [Ramlibacter agri]NML47038.1 Tim44 domain-containing protein [Ramlibacter agri]
MKKAAALMAVVLALGSTLAFDADAKRLGGGRSGGMQRSVTSTPATPPATPATPRNAQGAQTPATAPAAAGAAAAATPKRSWMGPIAGIAAGLGLAALASHFGFGEAMANMLTMALIAMAVLALVTWFMRKRMASQSPAAAGAPLMARTGMDAPQGDSRIGAGIGSAIGSALPATGAPSAIPADFDVAGFERNAKSQFLALQAANDARDMERLRDYVTPEMLDLVRAEITERGAAPQHTEVFGLQAQVLEVAQESDRYIVSVRFSGSVRTEAGAVPEDLAEVWHLTRSRAGLDGWVVAGIQQA